MNDPRDLWQSQEVEEMKIPVEELRAKAAKFQSRIHWRNAREYVAALVVIATFGRALWKNPHIVPRIASALIVAGAIYIVWHLWKSGAPKFLPADMGRVDCVRFYRRELERQRDLLRSVWKWYIGPLIPGMALSFIYAVAIAPADRRWHRVVGGAVLAAFIWIIGWMNQRAAGRLDGRIAELDREAGSV
jgi:hypothetical protein